MLGTLRFILAAMVVLNHLWLPTANKVGAHAVATFYIISGYLMTKVIQEVYGLSFSGARRFLENRALRIYPAYWFCMLSTLALLLFFGDNFSLYSLIQKPNAPELLLNVALIFYPSSPVVLVPPAWTLTVELFFYVAMVALLSRSKLTSSVWFAGSLIYTAWLIYSGASFADRYSAIPAASMFFSIGAMLYWHLDRFKNLDLPRAFYWPTVLFFCFSPLVAESLGFDRLMTGFYAPALLGVFLTAQAVRTPETRFDRKLGDLAYPIFLSHFLCGGIIRLAFPSMQPLGASFLVLSLMLSLLLSVVIAKLQSATIDRTRSKIRSQSPLLSAEAHEVAACRVCESSVLGKTPIQTTSVFGADIT